MQCPIPINDYPIVTMAHGGGGTLSRQLVQQMFIPIFESNLPNKEHDSAVIDFEGTRLAFTTDSYVVKPIFFPGGNIGELAVYGTVNDLAVAGAKPLYISAGFIIEEGFAMEELWKIVLSMKSAADRADVKIITGDTKVIDKGKGDKIFINTSGIGELHENIDINPANCRPGDKIIVSGAIAEHGIAVMAAREGLNIESNIVSDTAPLNSLIAAMLKYSDKIRVMRDPTRGGISSTLNEIAEAANIGILIEEEKIPLKDQVSGACEILGLDPLYLANEGKLIAVVDDEFAPRILEEMRRNDLGKESEIIGEITAENRGLVTMLTQIGSKRIVDMISGEQLPRIC